MTLTGNGQAFASEKKVVTVAADGSGDFRDVQTALDAAPLGGLIVRIKPGIYHEVLNATGNGVELRGLGARSSDVVLTFGNSHAMAGGTGKSASTTVSGDDFLAENVTFENSFSHEHPETHTDAQAVALLVQGDRAVLRHVRLLGAQDTLYANSKTCHSAEEIAAAKPCQASRMLIADSYIEGHVDFIFGDALNPQRWAEWDAKLATSRYAEFGSRGLAEDLSKRIGSRQLEPEEAARQTVRGWLAGADHWDAEAIR